MSVKSRLPSAVVDRVKGISEQERQVLLSGGCLPTWAKVGIDEVFYFLLVYLVIRTFICIARKNRLVLQLSGSIF